MLDLLLRLCGHRDDPEDLLQETISGRSSNQDSFREGTNARAWLMRIASNAFLGRRRRTMRRRGQCRRAMTN